MSRRWAVALSIIAVLVGLGCKKAGTGGGTEPPPGADEVPGSMVALGDSITAGFASCLAPVACPRNSWSTGDGTQVNSHYRRILAIKPAIRGHARNLSVPGARAEALTAQARAAVTSKAEYITLQVGADDACRDNIDDMTDPGEFRTQVDRALDILKKGMPDARLLVISTPNIYHLWEIGKSNKVAVAVWKHGICPSLLANPNSDATADVARRSKFKERVAAYNRELSRACLGYGAKCRYDGDPARTDFTLNDTSVLDFFHPNGAGQNRLADVTYPGRFTW